MKYASWTIDRSDGSTPEPTIRDRGGEASGGFMKDTETVVGYVWSDCDLTGLDKWNFATMTDVQALTIAQGLNAQCFLGADGTIQSPAQE
jgi:hypothetical protein